MPGGRKHSLSGKTHQTSVYLECLNHTHAFRAWRVDPHLPGGATAAASPATIPPNRTKKWVKEKRSNMQYMLECGLAASGVNLDQIGGQIHLTSFSAKARPCLPGA